MAHSAPTTHYERAHPAPVCGVDEAGRGPWAGPVVAAAVIWPDLDNVPEGLNDSKKLSATKREKLMELIIAHAQYGIGMASVEEIDSANILAATKLAMQRAVAALPVAPSFALIDGNQPPKLPCPALAIVKGDSKSVSIAAASIIAKVTRDQMMEDYAKTYAGYGFERHAGYGTAAHQAALAALGVSPIHRRSFAPIRALLERAA